MTTPTLQIKNQKGSNATSVDQLILITENDLQKLVALSQTCTDAKDKDFLNKYIALFNAFSVRPVSMDISFNRLLDIKASGTATDDVIRAIERVEQLNARQGARQIAPHSAVRFTTQARVIQIPGGWGFKPSNYTLFPNLTPETYQKQYESALSLRDLFTDFSTLITKYELRKQLLGPFSESYKRISAFERQKPIFENPSSAELVHSGETFAIWDSLKTGYLQPNSTWGPLNSAQLYTNPSAAERARSLRSLHDAVTLSIQMQPVAVVLRPKIPENLGSLDEKLAQLEAQKITQALEKADIEQLKSRLEALMQMSQPSTETPESSSSLKNSQIGVRKNRI